MSVYETSSVSVADGDDGENRVNESAVNSMAVNESTVDKGPADKRVAHEGANLAR